MLAFYIVICVVALVAMLLNLKRYLMMLQQNSYRRDRYSNWLRESKDSTSTFSLIGALVFMLGATAVPMWLRGALIGCYSCWAIARLTMVKYKKPLVFTNRVKRIYAVSILLVALLVALIVIVYNGSTPESVLLTGALALLLAFWLMRWIVVVANELLSPVEKSINKRYYDDAARILASMPGLKIIGITGSYGKTSTKHYLHRILSEQFDVLMTPGNFNTTLGVIRTVRENLKPYNQIFLVEMGAKQVGDIKEICDLVHPTIGIVTAVGPQHLESFGSIENVQATKFELIDALPTDGLAVVNNDFEYIANRPVQNVECVRYSVDPDVAADYHATDIKYAPTGTTFTIRNANGPVMELHTSLVGSCNVSNLIAAVIVALRLGVSHDKIRYAVEKIQQVEHRLNMKRTAGGITIIDDAYNSNPVGSKMALEVLRSMQGGKRIVITPGMVELGKDQYELNRELGREIARSVDVAIIVGEYNRDAIVEGIKEIGMPESALILASNFAEAQQRMLAMAAPRDTVLYENDLPDTFK